MSQTSSITQTPASQLNTRKYKILIDTDIGDDIDDTLALSLALCSPEIELLGVTTVFGDTQKRAHLAAHLLKILGHKNIPVAAGQQMPLLLRHRPSGVPQAAILDRYVTSYELSPYSGPEFTINALTQPIDSCLAKTSPSLASKATFLA